ncbi:MAG: cyclopropane-fatty-acyl-phospholipid synthase [Gammaproteobacteria bacterium RIFCSPHIGHO2_12_FULL_43_28]|nr:MAG: cyclopropane-fatty-acyl-phospholipid synthase [Gammaproteobacteria bacterium RIFCSPHIGHO2_12_FULL_43_28]
MNKQFAKDFIIPLAESAGIKVNGQEPWDIQIHDDAFYTRVLGEGALGLGESYMDKWWDCPRLDIFFTRLLTSRIDEKVKNPFRVYLRHLLSKLIDYQSKARAKEVAYKHYDIGNDLFSLMLDRRMMYSCGYWKEVNTLAEAQEAKLDLICRKLQLAPGQRLLDIGCGWGGLARYAAERYGVSIVGITISAQQKEYAATYCKGLPIDIRLQDYRDINEKFDRIVSVGMFEHVGHDNYPIYMKTARQLLRDNGLFLLHTIGLNETGSFINEWTTKYIFPNGMLPSIAQIAKSAEKWFVIEDWHNFGAYYDNTLTAWHENFNKHWSRLKNSYDERFYRMWNYYLLSCAGGFRARSMQLWQILLSPNGVSGGYDSIR